MVVEGTGDSKFHYVSIKIRFTPVLVSSSLALNSTMFLLRLRLLDSFEIKPFALNSTMFLLRFLRSQYLLAGLVPLNSTMFLLR